MLPFVLAAVHGAKTYSVHCNTKRNYADSVKFCETVKGRYIATFQSDADVAMAKVPSNCDAYIGAEKVNGKWTWRDGTKWWQYGKNDGLKSGETRVAVVGSAKGEWHDWQTGEAKLGAICQQLDVPDMSLVASDGTMKRPHCGWSNGCKWNQDVKNECAVKLCQKAGFDGGHFVSSKHNMCKASFTAKKHWIWNWTKKVYQFSGMDKETNIVANCIRNVPVDMPVNCVLSKWTKWGSCSKKCGSGKQKRLRHIKTEAKHGGTCDGELEESKDCNIRECTQHDAVVEHVDVVENMIDAVAKSHSGMDKSVAKVGEHVQAVAAVKTKAIADLKAIRDKLTAMKGKLNDKKTKLGKEDATITEALSELKARWMKLNNQQAEKLKDAEVKRAAHEKKIKTMLSNMERRRRMMQLARAI